MRAGGGGGGGGILIFGSCFIAFEDELGCVLAGGFGGGPLNGIGFEADDFVATATGVVTSLAFSPREAALYLL